MLNESQRSQLEKVLLGERDRLVQAAKDGLKFSMERERSIGRDSIDETMEEELFSTELREAEGSSCSTRSIARSSVSKTRPSTNARTVARRFPSVA